MGDFGRTDQNYEGITCCSSICLKMYLQNQVDSLQEAIRAKECLLQIVQYELKDLKESLERIVESLHIEQ